VNFVVRKAVEADHAFIYATYLRNRYFDKANKTTLKRSTWSALQHKRLEGILADSSSPVLVACLSDDDDTILGYVLQDAERPYIYVKLAFRGVNPSVADMLLKAFEAGGQ